MTSKQKQKTKSFTYLNTNLLTVPDRHLTEVQLSKRSSKSIDNSLEYTQMAQLRFLRKDIDKNQVFDPRVFITNELSYEDVIDLKQVFDTYDSTDMGVMLPNDLKLFLQQNGFNPNKTTVYDIMAEFDDGETGALSFKDFMKAMGTKPQQNQTKKQVLSVFKKYDKQGKGYLNIEDLKQFSRRTKQDMQQQTLLQIIKREDLAHDGKIYFQQFYKVMARGYTWL